jgi:hypothetical protein
MVSLAEVDGHHRAANADHLLVYRPDQTVKVEELHLFVDNAVNLMELMRRPTFDFDYPR